jgi:hypothetical protein
MQAIGQANLSGEQRVALRTRLRYICRKACPSYLIEWCRRRLRKCLAGAGLAAVLLAKRGPTAGQTATTELTALRWNRALHRLSIQTLNIRHLKSKTDVTINSSSFSSMVDVEQ